MSEATTASGDGASSPQDEEKLKTLAKALKRCRKELEVERKRNAALMSTTTSHG